MTDGPIKKAYESRLTKLCYKKFLLEERRERYGIIALLKKITRPLALINNYPELLAISMH